MQPPRLHQRFLLVSLALLVGGLSACGGQAVADTNGGVAGEAGSGGSSATGGTGGADGGSGGGSLGGYAGTGVGGSAATGGSAGTGSGGQPIDAGPPDSGPIYCFDNSGCPSAQWCDIEPAAPGMCSTGGKAGVCSPRPAMSDCPVYDQCPGACGCDGTWFCDACQAHVQGTAVTDDNAWCQDGGSGIMCGGFAGIPCPEGEYCDFPPDQMCGWADGAGLCRTRPLGCDDNCPGACGCDGQFYCNECDAHAAGVDITGGTECINPGGSCETDTDCGPSLKCCYPCGIPGCTNQCMAPDSNGECPMFP